MDHATLLLILGLISVVSCAASFINWHINRTVPGLLNMAIAYFLMGMGILLLSTQSSLPPFISIFFANALILAGRVPYIFGLASFWNQEKSPVPLLCIVWVVGSIIGLGYYTFVEPSIIWRIRIYTVMMVVYSLSSVFILVNGLRIEHKLRPMMAISTNVGAYTLIGVFMINSIADFILMLFRQDVAILAPDRATTAFLISGMFVMLVAPLATIIMTMEELSVENKENAIFDPVTTILNYRTFLEVSQRVLGVALRYSKPVSILTIEVVNLDSFVKKFGTRVANELLRHFSLMATDCRRNEDVLARAGFNQFHMLLPGVDEAGAEIVKAKVLQSVNSEDFVYRGKKLDLHIVAACITTREEDLHLQQMLQECELAMFKAKQNDTQIIPEPS